MYECETCQVLIKREGSEPGPLVDFLNHVADVVRDKYAYRMAGDPASTAFRKFVG